MNKDEVIQLKTFIEIGYVVIHATKHDMELLNYLYSKNLLKFPPKEKEIFNFEKNLLTT